MQVNKRVLGFTILEMLLVIAMIGILLSFAVPTYRDHLVRTRVTEGLVMVTPAKLAVSEYYMQYHHLPNNPEVLNFHAPEATENVSQISVGPSGVITVVLSDKAGDGSIIFTPTVKSDGRLHWCCDGGTLAVKYRPHSCRCEF
jgi:type IV pilus assembly protein PilA